MTMTNPMSSALYSDVDVVVVVVVVVASCCSGGVDVDDDGTGKEGDDGGAISKRSILSLLSKSYLSSKYSTEGT